MPAAQPPYVPDGFRFERLLVQSERSRVCLVSRAGEPWVLRVGGSVQALAAELSATLRVRAQGLVPVAEWGRTRDGEYYTLRPFVEGRRLDEAVAAGAAPAAAVTWVRSLLATLDELHAGDFVHRDLKAGNVIVDGERALLVDLDLAAPLAFAPGAAGTPLHIAPEVLLGQPHGPAADLFSLGAMLAIAYGPEPKAGFHGEFPRRSFWEASGLSPEAVPAELRPLVTTLVRRHPLNRPTSARAASALLPDTPSAGARDPRVGFLAGRDTVLHDIVERVRRGVGVLVVSAFDPVEIEPLAQEVQLELALRGVAAERCSLARWSDSSGSPEKLGAPAVVLTASDPHEGRAAAEAARAFAIQPEGGGAALVLVLPGSVADQVLLQVRSQVSTREAGGLGSVRFPGISEAALAAHLDRLADGASPVTARRLARSLWRQTNGLHAAVNRRLATAADDGVMRADQRSWVLLVDDWPSSPDGKSAASLDDLPAEATLILASIALLADRAALPEAIAATGLGAAAVRRGMRALSERAIFRAGAASAARALVADSGLLRAAEASLSATERRALHRRCADVLAARGAARPAVAVHRACCATRSREFDAVLEVAEDEYRRGGLGLARRLAELVAQASDRRHKRVRARAAVLRARLELGQGNALEALAGLRHLLGGAWEGAPEEVLLVGAEAAELAGERATARRLYQQVLQGRTSRDARQHARVGLGYSAYLDGDLTGALEQLEGIPAPDVSPETAGAAWNLRGGTLARLERHEEAAEALAHARRHAEASGQPTLVGRTLLNQAYLDRRRGRPAEALASLTAAREAFDRADHVKLRALAMNNLGVLHRDRGELVAAREMLQASLALRRRMRDSHGSASSLASLGIVALDACELSTSIELLQIALAGFDAGHHLAEYAFVAGHYSIALSLAGRWEEAAAALAKPATTPEASPHSALYARARAARRIAMGDRERAVSILREATEAATPLTNDAERFRIAAWLRALAPAELDLTELRARARALASDVHAAELEWLSLERPGEAEPEELRALLRTFEQSGRNDLVCGAALAHARVLDRQGDYAERRRASARAEAANEAMTAGLPSDAQAAAFRRLAELAGYRPPSKPEKHEVDAQWLAAWNRRLVEDPDLESLLYSTVDLALEITGARRGLLVLVEGDELDVQVARGMDHRAMPLDEVHFSRTVIREAIRTRAPIIVTDAANDERFGQAASVVHWRLRSVLCVPLLTAGGAQGSLYLDDELTEAVFDDYDARNVGVLADQSAIAVMNRRRQAEIAALSARVSRRRRDAPSALETPPEGGAPRTDDTTAPDDQTRLSAAMQRLQRELARLAPTRLPVLIGGPSGSRKEDYARELHAQSSFASGPLVSCNAAAIPVASCGEEFFGSVSDGFSGTPRRRLGLLARAEGGTLFIDEVEGLPPTFQTELLRALERAEYRPVGSRRARQANLRVVSAHGGDLADRANDGRFLPALYYFLAAAEIVVPSLAERIEDIPEIVRSCLDGLNECHGTAKTIAPAVVAALVQRPWNGELRELTNEVSRLYFLAPRDIEDAALVRLPQTSSDATDPMPASYRLEDVERAAIVRALEAAGQNKERAARLLGISRAGLYKKLERLGLAPG